MSETEQTTRMPTVKKVLAFGSLGFTGLTFFATLGVIVAFAAVGITIPEQVLSANQVSLGAVVGSFLAVVNYLLVD